MDYFFNKIPKTHRIVGKPFPEQVKTKMGKKFQFIPQAVEKHFETESWIQGWGVNLYHIIKFRNTTESRYKHAEGFLF